jgi:hypothetical protein
MEMLNFKSKQTLSIIISLSGMKEQSSWQAKIQI